jgi:hypothetical protein
MTRPGRESEVDAGFAQAYLDVTRLCPTAHPPHRTQCMQSAFPVVALQGTIQAHPHSIASGCCARSVAHLTRDYADSLRRVVLKTERR